MVGSFESAQVRVEMRLFGDVTHALLVGDQVAANGLAAEKDFARPISIRPAIISWWWTCRSRIPGSP